MAVVVGRAEAAVDLRGGEDEAAPFAERDDLLHRHLGLRAAPLGVAMAGTVAAAIIPQPVPIYEYKCENGHVFDVMQKMADEPLTECQECGAPAVRVLHSPAVHFKGSGFYNTDYGKKKKGAAAASSGSDGGESKGSDSGSSDSGSSGAGKSESKQRVARPPPRPATEPRSPQPRKRLTARRRTSSGTSSGLRGREVAFGRVAAVAAEDLGGAAAADRGGEHQLRHREEAHVADERFRRVPADDRALDEVVGGAQRVGEAVLDPVDDRLLGLAAVEVAVAEGVGALAGAGAFARLADAGVGERLFAVERVLALAQAQGDRRPGRRRRRRRCRRRACGGR